MRELVMSPDLKPLPGMGIKLYTYARQMAKKLTRRVHYFLSNYALASQRHLLLLLCLVYTLHSSCRHGPPVRLRRQSPRRPQLMHRGANIEQGGRYHDSPQRLVIHSAWNYGRGRGDSQVCAATCIKQWRAQRRISCLRFLPSLGSWRSLR